MEQLKWVATAPQEDGIYWWKCNEYLPRVVKVMNGVVYQFRDGEGMSKAMASNDRVFPGVRWAGPIPYPAP